MIAHVVLLKPRPDLTAADRRAFVNAFETAARQIPSVRNVRVGRRVLVGAAYEARMPDAADFLGIIEFDDAAGLKAYLEHPAHAELSREFATALEAAQVFDFECGGLDLLRAFETDQER